MVEKYHYVCGRCPHCDNMITEKVYGERIFENHVHCDHCGNDIIIEAWLNIESGDENGIPKEDQS